jgi:hypothetical protein
MRHSATIEMSTMAQATTANAPRILAPVWNWARRMVKAERVIDGLL